MVKSAMHGIVTIVLPICLLAFLSVISLSGCAELSRLFKQDPQIAFEPQSVDLGKVEEGVEIKTFFMIKNEGKKDLKIHEAHSTCGCTVPVLKQNELKPGESTKLDVTVDTSMKQGLVTKSIEVSSNDPASPVVSLPIKLDVKNRHIGLNESGKAKILTDEKCMSCHVDKGVGLAGKDLFEADCAMCHGENAKGAVGGALIYGDYKNEAYKKHIREVISFGSKTHRSMPGFLDVAGGPLIKDQVDSLVDYLAELSEKEKGKKKTQ